KSFCVQVYFVHISLPSFPTRRSSDLGLQEIDACFDMVTVNGARTLQIDDYGLEVGKTANIVVHNAPDAFSAIRFRQPPRVVVSQDRKSTRLNSSHVKISYAVFCVKKK